MNTPLSIIIRRRRKRLQGRLLAACKVPPTVAISGELRSKLVEDGNPSVGWNQLIGAYQAKHRLKVTHRFDFATRRYLATHWKGNPVTPPPPPPPPRIRHGIDYAWSHPGPLAIKQAGMDFAARYLSRDPSKDLTPQEAKALAGQGIDIVVVWETVATRANQGYDAGRRDAQAAQAKAVACGAPAKPVIYFAVDFDTNGHPEQVLAYFRGVNSVMGGPGRVGVYGGIEVVNYLTSAERSPDGRTLIHEKLCAYGWQTIAWSGGRWSDRAQLRQTVVGTNFAGIDCDLNEARAADFGQWKPK